MIINLFFYNYLPICVCFYVISFIYSKISKENLKVSKVIYYLLLFAFSFLAFLNNLYNISSTTFLIHLIILSIFNKLIYKEDIVESFLNVSIIYVVVCILELVLSLFIIIFLPFLNIAKLSETHWFITLFTLINMVLTYLFFYFQKTLTTFLKLSRFLVRNKDTITKYILLFLIIVIGLTCYKNITNNSNFKDYFSNVIILICFIFIIVFLFFERLKTEQEKDKQKALLEYMVKYELIIDEQRINEHELLNNLLALKFYENRQSFEYEKTLDSLIENYDSKTTEGIETIYNLPTGIKGIIYYKIHLMKAKEIKVIINVSKTSVKFLKKLKTKNYLEVCKILGILLDNADEAALVSEEKEVVIEIFLETEFLNIYIENTTNKIINLSNINKKNVSTKGKNRGIGLFVVNKIIKTNNCYNLSQKLNSQKRFVSILKIDIKKASNII